MADTFTDRIKGSIAEAIVPASLRWVGGFLLCLTGIGCILGIPLFIIAIGILVKAPKEHYRVGACPYCGTPLGINEKELGADCPACKQRVVLSGERFYTI